MENYQNPVQETQGNDAIQEFTGGQGLSLLASPQDASSITAEALEENRNDITVEALQIIQNLWNLLLNNTNSTELKQQLKKLVSKSKYAEEKIKNKQATNDEIISIIQDLTIHLKSVSGMVKYYKSSWNSNYLELLSMIKPVVWYFNGVCENLLSPNDQRIQNLIRQVDTCIDDIKSAIESFKRLSHCATGGWFAGAVASGIATVILIFKGQGPPAGIAASVAIVCGYSAYRSYHGMDRKIKDGEDIGEAIKTKSM